MRRLRDIPIRHKLTIIVLLASSIALLVACAVFIIIDRIEMRNNAVHNLQILADVIGSNSTAALAFDSEADAAEMLTALKAQTHIVSACIYTAAGRQFARYFLQNDSTGALPLNPSPEGYRFGRVDLTLSREIMLHNKIIGTIYLRSDLQEFDARMKQYVFILTMAFVLSNLVAFFVVSRIQKAISQPINQLTEVARHVSAKRDYSIRASGFGKDEVGFLIQVFNEMLGNIQQRDSALQDARDGLETRVRERTAELENEITERRLAEEAVRRSESKYRTLFDTANDSIFIMSGSIFIDCNRCTLVMFGCQRDQIVGQSPFRFSPPYQPDGQNSMEKGTKKVEAVLAGSPQRFEWKHIKLDGTPFDAEVSLERMELDDKIFIMAIVRDITQRRVAELARQQLQEQLDRAERMESLGLLAGGVAHDLNNMLGPVVGYSELLVRELPSDSKSALKAKKIGKSAEEAAAVIQDLLTLARRGRYEMHPLEINDVIRSYLDSPSFERLKERHSKTSVIVNLSSAIKAIIGSEVHLGKVVMNLVTNAFEAMPTGGTLSIQSEIVRIDKLYSGYQNVEEGEYVVFRVKDTGSGIAEEDISRIFEPYFSKKKLGQSGSGLGLSVVYGIVKDHKGYYDLRSGVGIGTEFILYFPVSGPLTESDKPVQDKIVGGSETILIVDDSPDQREMTKEIIESLGYSVLTAENGHTGVESIRNQPTADLIVLDMIMEPEFDGLDTYREMLKIRPDQKAIIVSGFSATERVQAVLDLGARAFVKKPYNIGTLARALRSALDGPTGVCSDGEGQVASGGLNLPTLVSARPQFTMTAIVPTSQ